MIPNARTFILGIPRCSAKRAATMAHLESHGIIAEPFDGVDFEISGLRSRWPYERDRADSGFNIGHKLVNLYLTHFMAWNVCLHLPDDVFVFFEDDVRFDDGWKAHFNSAIEHLPSDWDVLYIGSCCVEDHRGRHQVHDRLWEIRFALCCHAYAVRKAVLPSLIQACRKIFAPVDIAIITEVQPQLRRFAILPRIATQLDTVIPP